ncbi:hypothetical protein CBOM_00358 [Ceraceosorus bombacis]|uniref:Uncharacterized protein n=1 Tax=Ceraceosorus bombacis TaxID=401625 RepID=A0A0P1B8T3_9BASI|nr:hypothetical protein CBOM_00358 [Ceraceosorus bombacis]
MANYTSTPNTQHAKRGAFPSAQAGPSAIGRHTLSPNIAPEDQPYPSRLSLDAGSSRGGSDVDESEVDAVEHEREMEALEDSVRQTRTIEEFTAIIGQFRNERRRRSRHLMTASGSGDGLHADGTGGRPASVYSEANDVSSIYDPRTLEPVGALGDDAASIITTGSTAARLRVQVRVACCCEIGDGGCDRGRRAAVEWADMESDLRLAAEIGQALLRDKDALSSSIASLKAAHSQQMEKVMSRMSNSIRESAKLERELKQCNLNLEASDSGNRALLAELDDVRAEVGKLRLRSVKLNTLEAQSTRLHAEMDDLKQELAAERKRADAAEVRARKAGAKTAELGETLRAAKLEADVTQAQKDRESGRSASMPARDWARAQERLRASIATLRPNASGSNDEAVSVIESLITENEALRRNNGELKTSLNAANEEVHILRDQALHSPIAEVNGGHSFSPQSKSSSLDARAPKYGDIEKEGSPSRRAEKSTVDTTMDLSELQGEPGRRTLADEIIAPAPKTLQRPSAVRSSSRSSIRTASTNERVGSPRQMEGRSPFFSSSVTAESHAHLGADVRNANMQRKVSGASAIGSVATDTTMVDFGLAADEAGATIDPPKTRDNRTAQLSVLLDHIQRIFTRLSSADVDTLARRLQRQHLKGDVGHLARTTVNGILREVEGLRDHFRKLIEAEARGNANGKDDASSMDSGARDRDSESLLARKEFFVLLKLFRDLFTEMARLRNAVNEVHLQPQNAARILQEQLGAATAEDKGVGAWIGRLFSGGPNGPAGPASGLAPVTSTGSTALPSVSLSDKTVTNASSSKPLAARAPTVLGRPPSRGGMAPRAPITSGTAPVEVKGLHSASTSKPSSPLTRDVPLASSPSDIAAPPGATLQAGPRPALARGRGSLSRTQSRNLSGLFAGSMPSSEGWDIVDRRDASGERPSSIVASQIGTHGPPLRNLHLRGLDQTSSGGGRPLSRIVDDDEISIRDGFIPERPLRPRGLSDSSIRSTYLDDGNRDSSAANHRPPPMGRLITPSTLALQAQTSHTSATARGLRVEDLDYSPAPSESSASTASAGPKASSAAQEVGRAARQHSHHY